MHVVTEAEAVLGLVGLPLLAFFAIVFAAWQLGLWNRLSLKVDDDQEEVSRRGFLMFVLFLALAWMAWRYFGGHPLMDFGGLGGPPPGESR